MMQIKLDVIFEISNEANLKISSRIGLYLA